ncbi:MAG: ribosome silencing factor [Arenicellales bacterium]|nr:ribosome silencing factor [Arenicellales bacterium]
MREAAIQPEELKNLTVDILDDMKAENVEVLNVRKLTDVTDYMVIASGTSDRHVKAMAHRLRDQLREQSKLRPLGVEGEQQGDWVLIDFGDVVVHIMRPQTREYYDLERLWSREVEELVKMNRDASE